MVAVGLNGTDTAATVAEEGNWGERSHLDMVLDACNEVIC